MYQRSNCGNRIKRRTINLPDDSDSPSLRTCELFAALEGLIFASGGT